MSLDSQKLPEARLVPKDGADRMVVLRARASSGARKVGRVAATTTKALAMVALCGAGLVAIGAGARTRSSYDSAELDRRIENLRRINETLRQMPKIDMSDYYRNLRTLPLELDSRANTSGLVHESGASPSQSISSP
jgi:hypothetical protein